MDLFFINHNGDNSLESKGGNVLDDFYSFLIVFEKKSFELKYNSSSKWYRTFSNSNQITGNKSNRKFWNNSFIGGQYNTIICENEILLHFILELKNPIMKPNDLDMKFRIGKSSKGIKYKLFLYKDVEIEKKLLECQNCSTSIRNVGKWYYNNLPIKSNY